MSRTLEITGRMESTWLLNPPDTGLSDAPKVPDVFAVWVLEDEQGNRAEMARMPISMSGEKPEPGLSADYQMQINVSNRAQKLVFSLTDKLGGTTLSPVVNFTP